VQISLTLTKLDIWYLAETHASSSSNEITCLDYRHAGRLLIRIIRVYMYRNILHLCSVCTAAIQYTQQHKNLSSRQVPMSFFFRFIFFSLFYFYYFFFPFGSIVCVCVCPPFWWLFLFPLAPSFSPCVCCRSPSDDVGIRNELLAELLLLAQALAPLFYVK
jgi:hypothetical protein